MGLPGTGPSAVTCVGGILTAASREGGRSSNRLIGDPPEDAVAGAIRREQSTFVETVQSVSDFPLDTDEAGAIGRVQPGVDHHGPDEVWCADRRTRPTKRIEHTA
jgi:hypothetical protein